MTTTLFQDLVLITEDYLGPVARRFITRQIAFHIHKSPEQITPEDIGQICEWSKATLALLTDDQAVIAEFERRLRKLEHRDA